MWVLRFIWRRMAGGAWAELAEMAKFSQEDLDEHIASTVGAQGEFINM